MELTPACVEAAVQSSTMLWWLSTSESLTTVLVILGIEVVIHALVFMRVVWIVADACGAVVSLARRIYRWRQYRALPVQGRVMYDWSGTWLPWTPPATIYAHRGRLTKYGEMVREDRLKLFPERVPERPLCGPSHGEPSHMITVWEIL